MLQIDKLYYCVHVIYNNGILEIMCCNKETRTAPTGFMLLLLTYKECIHAYRPEPFLFTSTISANVNKSLCRLLFWPFPSYPFVVLTGAQSYF
jgi:hypothetical protein